jgi:hypothetical protein
MYMRVRREDIYTFTSFFVYSFYRLLYILDYYAFINLYIYIYIYICIYIYIHTYLLINLNINIYVDVNT